MAKKLKPVMIRLDPDLLADAIRWINSNKDIVVSKETGMTQGEFNSWGAIQRGTCDRPGFVISFNTTTTGWFYNLCWDGKEFYLEGSR